MSNVDDQFYLLVADRMWHGDLPYVDIWDRKPIGLFLLYALFRPFSLHGIVAYQVAASGFVVATAFTIVRIGTRIGSIQAATAAGVLYIIYLPAIAGNSGQSPVFYNLFMAIAALQTIRASETGDRRSVVRRGLLAMALVGIAIQIKYPAFVEGIAFGTTLVWVYWRRDPRLGPLALCVAALAGLALLPTGLAVLYYVVRGFGGAFAQANFLSIFLAREPPGITHLSNLEHTAFKMAPMLVFWMASLAILLKRGPRRETLFLLWWCGFAFIGFFIIGRFYGHYAQPLLVVLVIMTVPLLESIVAALVVMTVVSLFVVGLLPTTPMAANQRHVDRMVELLTPYATKGCLYLRDGPLVVYSLTGSCLPTPYVFPEHLNTILESRATNASISMAALLTGRPTAIVLSDRTSEHPIYPDTAAQLDRAIKANYHWKAVVTEPNGTDHQTVYVRNDLD